jgi:hypothetical protein
MNRPTGAAESVARANRSCTDWGVSIRAVRQVAEEEALKRIDEIKGPSPRERP